MTQARQMLSPLRRLGAHASLAEIGNLNMTKTHSFIVAALLSGAAAVTFAQTPAVPAAAPGPVHSATTAATTAQAHAAAKPVHRKHHRHHAKKAGTATPATSTTAPAVVK